MAGSGLVGKVLEGRYEVVSRLGAGGMATVYLARDRNLRGRQVVVKVPDPTLLRDASFAGRFDREVRSLIELEHEHVVPVLDVGAAEGVPFVVLKHMEGGNLEEQLELAGGSTASRAVRAWLPPIALALDHVHRKGVIHRDVKPANILFDSKGTAFLSDFGIVKALDPDDDKLTRTGTAPGSRGYMAPEFVEGRFGAAYDQYSLAACVLRSVTGEEPARRMLLSSECAGLEARIGAASVEALRRGMAVEPGDRFPSCWTFAETFLADETRPRDSSPAEPAPAPEPAGVPPRRRLPALLVTVVLLAAAAAVYVGSIAKDEEPGRDSKAPRIRVDSPPDGFSTREGKIVVRGRLEDDWPATLAIGGEEVPLAADFTFRLEVPLEEGKNRIVLAGADRAGNPCRATVTVDRDSTPPEFVVESPPAGFLTRESSVRVVCRLADPHPGEVRVNGDRVAADARGRAVTTVALEEGENRISLRGEDALGNRSDTIVRTVTRDSTPPVVALAPGIPDRTKASRVTVSGTVSEDGCSVTVAGKGAAVRGRGFTATVTLREGANRVDVVARDEAGNEARKRLTVTRETAAALPGRAPSNAHRYREGTVTAFARLLRGAGWKAADPAWNAQGLLEAVHERTGLVFVLVPGGTFRMGSDDGDRDERPVHEVTVPAFLLAKTECTQRAWDRVGGEDDREWRGADLPIEDVSWDDVTAWCEKAGLQLPSESEWEYACRAGSRGKWCFGDDEERLSDYAWYFVNSGKRKLPTSTDWDLKKVTGKWGCRTHDVAVLKPNAWGIHDMHGNVWEWCEDAWHTDYDGAPTDGSAWEDAGAGGRVSHGGGWLYAAVFSRSALRDWDTPGNRRGSLGFRPRQAVTP